MTSIERELARPSPLGQNASSADRVRFLREWLRPFAATLAAMHLVGEEDNTEQHQRDVLLAAIAHAERHTWPRAEGIAAAEAEWQAGLERIRAMLAALKSRVWPLGRMKAPSARIIAEAERVNDQFGVVLPTEILLDQAAAVAQAAMPRARPKYAKRLAA